MIVKKWQKESYELGIKLAGTSVYDIVSCGLAPDFVWLNFEARTFFYHGHHGLSFPKYVRGWRYGDIPSSGQSYNYREQVLEQGVSVMEIYSADGPVETADKFSTMFCAVGRKRVEVAGFLNSLCRGSDGEPLLICVEVAETLLKN